jgi:hypothetical protein
MCKIMFTCIPFLCRQVVTHAGPFRLQAEGLRSARLVLHKLFFLILRSRMGAWHITACSRVATPSFLEYHAHKLLLCGDSTPA